KPLVDAIEGISPAVAIEQKNPTTSSRSTVGTATEIYDFLRLLWARIGTPYCVKCGREVKVDTVQEVVDALNAEVGTRKSEQEDDGANSAFRVPRSDLVIAFPLPASAHRPDVEVAAQLRAAGFVRAQLDGTVIRLDQPDAEQRVRKAEDVLIVVDRLPAAEPNRGRLTEAVATAFSEGEGVAVALENGDRRRFSAHPTCSGCGTAAPALTPILFSFLERLEAKRYKQYIRVFLRQYQLAKTCPACGGARLKPEALAVKVAGKTIAETAGLTTGAIRDWIAGLTLTDFQCAVAVHILAELGARVSFVNDVGLGYLTLDRLTRTLSGGEAQRIALSNALGAHLVDTLYVLDEPTIGLHPADTGRLLALLRRLADAGNTVVVVEH